MISDINNLTTPNSEFSELTNNEYFIIDSNNLNSINQKLYGFTVYNNEIISDFNIQKNMELSGIGTYVWVKKTLDNIEIYQDFNGSYGLFVFRKDDYFAISNSFIYLFEYLKNKYTLTLNKNFASSLFVSGLCSFIYSQTLINEIEMMPKHYKLLINLKNKKLNYEEIDYEEYTISIDSQEGIDTLDSWYNYWIQFIRTLKSNTDYISVDLSGGFDSRIVFALVLSSNIDLNKIKVNSRTDNNGPHPEDYEIASDIAKTFNFKLNNNLQAPFKYFSDNSTTINLSFYAKLGFHKQMYYKTDYLLNPYYELNGSGGEAIRSYWNYSPEKFIEDSLKTANFYSPELIEPAEAMLRDTFKKIQEKHNISDDTSNLLTLLLYKETRCRNHFGKSNTANYLTNRIAFQPLLDPVLHKLKLSADECQDNNLLISVILARYCPKLLDFKFEGDRKIDEETIAFAKKINEKYPFKKADLDLISESNNKQMIIPKTVIKTNEDKNVDIDQIRKFIQELFLSDYFKNVFEANFPKETYSRILGQMDLETLFIPENVYSSLAMIKIINDISPEDYYVSTDETNTINFEYLSSIKNRLKQLINKYR